MPPQLLRSILYSGMYLPIIPALCQGPLQLIKATITYLNSPLLRSSQRKTDSQTKNTYRCIYGKQNHMCPKEVILQRCTLRESPITDSTAHAAFTQDKHWQSVNRKKRFLLFYQCYRAVITHKWALTVYSSLALISKGTGTSLYSATVARTCC